MIRKPTILADVPGQMHKHDCDSVAGYLTPGSRNSPAGDSF